MAGAGEPGGSQGRSEGRFGPCGGRGGRVLPAWGHVRVHPALQASVSDMMVRPSHAICDSISAGHPSFERTAGAWLQELAGEDFLLAAKFSHVGTSHTPPNKAQRVAGLLPNAPAWRHTGGHSCGDRAGRGRWGRGRGALRGPPSQSSGEGRRDRARSRLGDHEGPAEGCEGRAPAQQQLRCHFPYPLVCPDHVLAVLCTCSRMRHPIPMSARVHASPTTLLQAEET